MRRPVVCDFYLGLAVVKSALLIGSYRLECGCLGPILCYRLERLGLELDPLHKLLRLRGAESLHI